MNQVYLKQTPDPCFTVHLQPTKDVQANFITNCQCIKYYKMYWRIPQEIALMDCRKRRKNYQISTSTCIHVKV